MTSYEKILTAMLKTEKELIGDVAVRKAADACIKVNEKGKVMEFEGDGFECVKKLISVYEELTGPVAKTVCRRALRNKFERGDLPDGVRDWI